MPEEPKVDRRVKGSTDHAYRSLKEMAIRYELRPGDKINEVAIAQKLNLSRTPVREALNRLVVENLIEFETGRGFVARRLDLEEILQLYELRIALETAAFRLSCERAKIEDVDALETSWTDATGENYENMTHEEIAAADEDFHRSLTQLSQNDEIVAVLDRITAQIRFCRLIDLEVNSRKEVLYSEHIAILDHLRKREVDAGVEVISKHIHVSHENALSVIKEGIARIYMP